MKEEEEEQIQRDKEHAKRLQKEEDTMMVSACTLALQGLSSCKFFPLYS